MRYRNTVKILNSVFLLYSSFGSNGKYSKNTVKSCSRNSNLLYFYCIFYCISPETKIETRLLKKVFVVYYESIKRELKTRPIYECRDDERLKTKAEESTRLVYTVFLGELEHLEIKTRLIDEMFSSVMGEYVFLK